jgi:NADPH-dependent curcumin reductase CurA
MRGRMNDVKSYVPPFTLDAPMSGGAVGEVVESRDPGLAVGDMVLHMSGWRDETVEPAANFNKLPAIPGVEPQAFLGNLGLTGGTAYFGLLEAASAKEADIVFVSAAAGAVGSAVVQIAKAKGMTVIGSAGGAEKCEFVRSLGADAVVDYKAGPVLKQLSEAAPKGIDVYFDNVGGDHLDAALALARKDARFAICGMIEGYNEAHPTSLKYIMRIIAMRIRLQGFIYTDYLSKMGDFYRDMGGWIGSGQVRGRETVIEGLENTPLAFLGLFTGANIGKMLVKL